MKKFWKYKNYIAVTMVIGLSLTFPLSGFANKGNYVENKNIEERFLFDKDYLVSKLETNKDSFNLLIKDPSITDINIEFIPKNGVKYSENIKINEFKKDNFHWDGDTGTLYLPKSSDEEDIIIKDQSDNLIKILYTYNGVVYEDIEDRESEKEKNKNKEIKDENIKDKDKDVKNIDNTFKQDIKYPMSKTVNFDKEIIKVNVPEGVLTDLYVNDRLIKGKIDHKIASIGLSIPLKKGLNDVKIISYKDDVKKEFKTVIFYNKIENTDNKKTNIKNLELTNNGGLKVNGVDIDKEIKELENMTPEEVEERLNKLREEDREKSEEGESIYDNNDNIIDVDLDMYFIFNKEYSNLETTDKSIIIYGKAVNAKELYANDTFIELDENNNFKFIFELDNGNNLLLLKSINDGGEYIEKIYIKRLNDSFEILDDINKTREEPGNEEEEIIVFDNNDEEPLEFKQSIWKTPSFYLLLIISIQFIGFSYYMYKKKNKNNSDSDNHNDNDNE